MDPRIHLAIDTCFAILYNLQKSVDYWRRWKATGAEKQWSWYERHLQYRDIPLNRFPGKNTFFIRIIRPPMISLLRLKKFMALESPIPVYKLARKIIFQKYS